MGGLRVICQLCLWRALRCAYHTYIRTLHKLLRRCINCTFQRSVAQDGCGPRFAAFCHLLKVLYLRNVNGVLAGVLYLTGVDLLADSPLAAVMTEELSWLEQYVLARRSDSTEGADPVNQERARGRAFGLQEVMCHNDLLSGNILLRTAKSSASSDTGGADDSAGDEGGRGDKGSEKRVFLIDYEYAAYNFRAFDLANHFSGEYCWV